MATNFNFNSSPFSFSDSFQSSNPMMEEFPILGQQDFGGGLSDQGGFSLSQLALPGIIGGGAPAVISSGSRLAPSGQLVQSFGRPIKNAVRLPQLALPGATTAASRFVPTLSALTGGFAIGSALDKAFGLSDKAASGIASLLGMDINQPAFTEEELAEISGPTVNMFSSEDRGSDPIRATYQLGPQYNNEIIQERESGEIFVPNASQLQSFMDGMEAASQPSATGIGPGGSQGVRFGGGEAPLSVDETRALLEERFGAPTISAIQALPAGEGLGLSVDPQGRMISQGDDRRTFDQRSAERLARLEQRDLLPGETLTERDTRLADARTGGAERGGEMSFEEARKFIPKGAKETTKSYNARIKAFQAQQNSTINQVKEQYEQLRVQGQVLNNERIAALAARYQQTEPQRYREVVQVAQAMRQDGFFEDDIQMAMYVIQEMGGKPSEIFKTPDGPTSSIVDQITQSGQGPASNTSTSPARVTVNSQSEYDRLEPGTAYLDSYGNPGTKPE